MQEIGLSGFRRIVTPLMKTSFQRLLPKISHYRDYSNYDNIFRISESIEVKDFNKFVTVCIDALNNHAPSKKKYFRGNHLLFMNKEL